MRFKHIIMGMAIAALPCLFIACSDDNDDKVGNDTSKPSVTGGSLSIGLTRATVEAYFNEDVLTQQYTAPEYGIEYSTSADFPSSETSTKSTDDIVGRKYTITLSGLDPSTTYYYRSYVKLPGYNRYLGQTRNFKTNTLKNIVTSISAEDITLSMATIKGQVDTKVYVETEDKYDEPYRVGFIYSTDKDEVKEDGNYNKREWSAYDFEYDDYDESGEPTKRSGSFDSQLSNLTPGETYYYASFTRINGTYAFSSVKSFKTGETITGSISLSEEATYTRATLTATLNVSEAYLEDPNVRCRIEWKDGDEWRTLTSQRDNKELTATISSLDPNASYSYRAVVSVRGSDSWTYNDVITSTTKTFTTKRLTGSITLGNAENRTFQSATISATLNIPEDAFSDNFECYVAYKASNASEYEYKKVTFAGTISTTLSGLSDDQQYSYKVQICSASGTVVLESATKTFKTEEFSGQSYPEWTSTNHADSSTSSHTWTFNVSAGNVLSFDYRVSSESGYDKLIITLNGTEIVNASGERTASYTKTFTSAGTVTLIAKYTKDNSQSRGSDNARVYNIVLYK